MLIEVRDAKEKFLGTLDLRSKQPSLVGESAEVFSRFVAVALRDGITIRRDVYNAHSSSYSILEEPITKDDPQFGLAFKDFLRRAGFIVRQLHPETDEAIKKLLEKFPNDNADKQDILTRLPQASFREKTFLLKKLQDLQS